MAGPHPLSERRDGTVGGGERFVQAAGSAQQSVQRRPGRQRIGVGRSQRLLACGEHLPGGGDRIRVATDGAERVRLHLLRPQRLAVVGAQRLRLRSRDLVEQAQCLVGAPGFQILDGEVRLRPQRVRVLRSAALGTQLRHPLGERQRIVVAAQPLVGVGDEPERLDCIRVRRALAAHAARVDALELWQRLGNPAERQQHRGGVRLREQRLGMPGPERCRVVAGTVAKELQRAFELALVAQRRGEVLPREQRVGMDGTDDAGIARRDVGQQADRVPTAADGGVRLAEVAGHHQCVRVVGSEGATIGREQRFEGRDGALRFAGLLRRQRDQVARAQRIAMRRAERRLAAAERLGAERDRLVGATKGERGAAKFVPAGAHRGMSIAEEAPPGGEGGAVVTGGRFRLPRSQPGEAGIVPGGECVGTCRGAQPIGERECLDRRGHCLVDGSRFDGRGNQLVQRVEEHPVVVRDGSPTRGDGAAGLRERFGVTAGDQQRLRPHHRITGAGGEVAGRGSRGHLRGARRRGATDGNGQQQSYICDIMSHISAARPDALPHRSTGSRRRASVVAPRWGGNRAMQAVRADCADGDFTRHR